MITKEKSQKIKQLKYLLVAPLLLSMLVLSSFEDKSKETLEQFPLIINEILNEAVLPKEIMAKEKEVVLKSSDTINPIEIEEVSFANIANVPVFPGCEGPEEELRACFQDKITAYVSANFNSGLAKGLDLESGVNRVYVLFKIDKDGNITEVKSRAPHKKLEEEAIRLISSMPKMTPGKHKGKTVGVKYALPIAFMVEGEKQEGIDANNESKVNPLYILDGKEISKEELNKIDAKIIKSMNVIKGEEALKKYGDKGKNGVVEIIIKQ